jgi:hypothetical protein
MNSRDPVKTKITLEVRNQFGRQDIYPACELSKILVQLTGRGTFNRAEIEILKRAGFDITLTGPKLEK